MKRNTTKVQTLTIILIVINVAHTMKKSEKGKTEESHNQKHTPISGFPVNPKTSTTVVFLNNISPKSTPQNVKELTDCINLTTKKIDYFPTNMRNFISETL